MSLSTALARTRESLIASELLLHFDQRHFVDAALRDYEVPVLRRHHVPHNTTAGGDGPGLELFGLRIEANQGVRPDGGFAIPDDVLVGGDAVRLRLGAAG